MVEQAPQFCSAWGSPCCANGPHSVGGRTGIAYATTVMPDGRRFHRCAAAGDFTIERSRRSAESATLTVERTCDDV